MQAGRVCLAHCLPTQCCSQYGRCENVCGPTCQCAYSGVNSYCPGSTLFTDIDVPVAAPGAVCGEGVASCPGAQCCSVFGFCTNDCISTPCNKALSGNTAKCNAPKRRIRRYDLTLHWKLAAPDGFQRQMIAINGEMPGPTIRCDVGDRLVVKVVNKLDAETTIHWHGSLQQGTLIQDGVPGVTQRPHYKEQYVDGLRGAMIVNDPLVPRFPVQFDVSLTDWYQIPAKILIHEFLSNKNSEGLEPIPTSALINGVGQASCPAEKSGSQQCGYPVIPAALGTCWKPATKLNLINMAAFARFIFSIDEHKIVILALDGLPVRPSAPLNSVKLNAGQRATVASVFPEESPNPLHGGGDGDDEAGEEDEYNLQPLFPVPPPAATTQVRLDILIEAGPDGIPWAHFNGISFQAPPMTHPNMDPMVETLLAGKPLAPNSNHGFHTISVKKGQVVDLVINNHLDAGEHPMHLHGHWFWVMARGEDGDGAFNPAKHPLKKTPVLRDTATVEANSYLVLRFVANNPGTWIFHCHIDWHLASGLAAVFLVM
ncbi:hypothetical protein COHA_003789 [Chlorella ohadii]|uniref:Multicopper oxidase n=1 Tax=Chlorella ohadii TaxID=2649997 RepID=A0AAD5DQT7_9CHLO|nr:hypothetical protein COHA_003789 [Chlorella ohadii]